MSGEDLFLMLAGFSDGHLHVSVRQHTSSLDCSVVYTHFYTF